MTHAILLVRIQGRVQGVGYRAWVEYQAQAAGLEGWVRNRRDGSVEALFAGAAPTVAELVRLCQQGPPSAYVSAVLNEPAEPHQLNLRRPGESFSVLPTV
ncbi:acylphosphatase [Bradyrhizobium sp. ARR65]|uniref:acylphosphatase n=1 Tax=unclassified Bradyrhizobium TaxID=2631580 RepID=UPI0004648F41|nr:acylphosphatase [Bradyrhizobium sp. ARR65]